MFHAGPRGRRKDVTDLALALFRRGYLALPELWDSRRGAADHVRTRLFGRVAHVVRGPEGARLFDDETPVERSGAVPAPLAHLLFGRGAVHGLDESEHRSRKALFDELVRQPSQAAQRLGRRTLEHVTLRTEP
jgi:fatty-acid peroxygenase